MSPLFDRNLEALRTLDAGLADRMASLAWPAEGLALFASRSGAPTLKGVSHDGAEILLHSEYDPAREAKQLIAARPIERHDAYLLNGFGLGYLALEYAARIDPARWIGVVEAHEGLFRAALEAVDLGPLLRRGRIRFFVGRDGVAFQAWFRSLLTAASALQLGVLPYPPCLRFFPSFYEDVQREVETGVNRHQVELTTIVRLGRNMDRNAVLNLVSLSKSHGVADLAGRFSDCAAVVVAAGPSLDRAMPVLREVKGRAPIICVGKALRKLLAEGVAPDFVTTLDMNPTTAPMFRGLEIPAGTVLVYDPDAWHEIAAEYPGRKVSYETAHPVSRWARAFLGDRGFLEKGQSVAHTSFFVAHALGASPILLVGTDLSVPGDRTHAEGVTMTWGGKADEVRRNWVEIPGANGRPVRTLANLRSFVTAFEGAIAKTGAKAVQTSEDGAYIRGAEHLGLAAAAEKYVRPGGIPVEERLREPLSRPPNFDLPAFDRASAALAASLERLQGLADDGLRVAGRLKRLDPGNRLDAEEASRKIARARAIQNGLLADESLTAIMGRLLARAVIDVQTIEREREAMDEKDPRHLAKATRQFESIFTAFSDATGLFLENLRPVRERLLRGTAR